MYLFNYNRPTLCHFTGNLFWSSGSMKTFFDLFFSKISFQVPKNYEEKKIRHVHIVVFYMCIKFHDET